LGVTFPMFFKMLWNGFKSTGLYQKIAGLFSKKA
jgi:hypothetical protein